MDVAVQVMNIVMPHFPLMHEMTIDHVHEEIQLLAIDFSSMLFETMAHAAWRDYYMRTTRRRTTSTSRRVLKAMPFLRGGRRWLLKSPQHLEQSGPDLRSPATSLRKPIFTRMPLITSASVSL